MDSEQDRRPVSGVEAAERLLLQKPEILRAWLEAVRYEVPAARRESTPALQDSLPGLLDLLRQALAEGARPPASLDPHSAQHQAHLRAQHPAYSLDQVVREYQVLRTIVLKHVAGEAPLEVPAHAILDEVFDAAIRQAALHFARETHGELRRVERDYELMVESTRDFAVITIDPGGRILTWNPGAEQIFLTPEAEAVGKIIDFIFVPEDREKAEPAKEMAQAVALGRAEDERWHLRADGSRFFGSGVLVPLRDGELRGFAKVLRDVTKRKLAEDERDRLLILEQQARAAAERITDRLHRLQWVTDVALTVSSEEELLQDLLRRVQEALRADTAAIMLKSGDFLILRAARGMDLEQFGGLRVPIGSGFAGRIASARQPLAVEDARDFPLHRAATQRWEIRSLLGVPLCLDGEVMGVLHVGTYSPRHFDEEDTHLLQLVADRAASALERARLLEETNRRSAQLETVARSAQRLLAEERPEEFLRAIYEELSRHLGMEVYLNYMIDETGTGLRLTSAGGLPPDVASRINHLAFGEAVCGEVARTSRPYVISDAQSRVDPRAELIRSLGITAYACHPLIAGEELLGTLSFGTRQRKQFMPEELALLHTLSDQVAIALQRARLIEELHRRAEELEDADRRKDEFLATLAHELRNPLAGIANAAYVLEHSSGATEQRQRLQGVIRRQTEHLSRMVDDLLDLSRITHGKIELRKEVVEVQKVVRQAVESVRPLMKAREHTFNLSLPEVPLMTCADPTRLEQILINLLNNAAKYTDPGGRVALSARQAGDQLVLEVRDTGIGIPPRLLSRIFDLFAQSDRALDRAEGGLGIGLSLVKRLVELHGGTIQAHSAGAHQGSTFTVKLPTLEAAAFHDLATDAAPEFPATGERPLRVLIVEDNPDAAETLRDILELWGLEVRWESSGRSAVTTFPLFQPDLVLMDIGLPEMDGYAAAAELRNRYDLSGTVLVALTGYGQEEDRRRSREAGFDYHLVKPLDPEALQPILATLPSGAQG